MKSLFNKDIRIGLLENIHPAAHEIFEEAGITKITSIKESPKPNELIDLCKHFDVIGLRSKTTLTADVLKQLPHLSAIGCFCVGTDQVDLNEACMQGIPVFNAPHSNTRSVAELVIGLIIMLMRDTFYKSVLAHEGVWDKSATGCHEIRGKTLGIIGYGHIGTQLSVLAEAMGMRVLYYDIIEKLPLGNAKRVAKMEELLKQSDVVTLHVPDTALTKMMVDEKFLHKMRSGAFLINASRGCVVDIDALSDALKEKKIAGAAIDVYPVEPNSNKDPFESALRQHSRVILTPHIGGSTEEAQEGITREVCHKLLSFLQHGNSYGAVNLPGLSLPPIEKTHRVVHIHKNIPGVLQQINTVIAKNEINILAQYLLTNEKVGYVVFDTSKNLSGQLFELLNEVHGTIRTHLVY